MLKASGSWHDSHVAHPIFNQLLHNVPDRFLLVSDTGFPCGSASITGKIQAPMKAGKPLPEDFYEQEQFFWYNHQLLSNQQTAEHSIIWKCQSNFFCLAGTHKENTFLIELLILLKEPLVEHLQWVKGELYQKDLDTSNNL